VGTAEIIGSDNQAAWTLLGFLGEDSLQVSTETLQKSAWGLRVTERLHDFPHAGEAIFYSLSRQRALLQLSSQILPQEAPKLGGSLRYKLDWAQPTEEFRNGSRYLRVGQSFYPFRGFHKQVFQREDQLKVFFSIAKISVDSDPGLAVARALLFPLKGFVLLEMRTRWWTSDLHQAVFPTAATADWPAKTWAMTIAPALAAVPALLPHCSACVPELLSGRFGESIRCPGWVPN